MIAYLSFRVGWRKDGDSGRYGRSGPGRKFAMGHAFFVARIRQYRAGADHGYFFGFCS